MTKRSSIEVPSGQKAAIFHGFEVKEGVEALLNAIDYARSLCPPNLPDEVLISDVGRYHILSANSTTTLTFHELFEYAPFPLNSWIPPHIGTLASRMPGDVRANALELLQYKTLFPLLQLFSALSFPEHLSTHRACREGVHAPQRTQRKHRDPIRIPQRTGTEATRMCLACLHEDFRTFGVPYIHLSHQVPGVQVCGKHDVELIYKCPFCECLFDRPRQLVLAPWRPCHCKRYLLDFEAPQQKSKDFVALSYARFAKDLLSSPPTLVQPTALVTCYKQRARELDYVWGSNNIHRNRLFTDIEKFYGKEFLAKVDPAYREGRLSGWFNLIHDKFVSEVPLSRHLLFAHFLFRTADQFWPRILEPVISPLAAIQNDVPVGRTTSDPSLKKVAVTTQAKAMRIRDLHRELVRVARATGMCTIEELWRNNYQTMKRLTLLDPNAVIRLKEQLKVIQTSRKAVKSEPVGPHPDDESRAQRVREVAENLYASTDKPERVSGNRLSDVIGWNPHASNKERFPATLHAFQEALESNWHFYSRRIVWAMLHLRHGLKCHIKTASGIEYHRFLVLLEYFQDVDVSVPLSKGAVMAILKQYGIERDWSGPCPDREFFTAGRNYYKSR